VNDIGKHVKRLRKENHISQEALADNLHVTRQAVSQWETGRTQPDLDTLSSIARFFNVDILTVIYGRKQISEWDSQSKKQHIKLLIVFGLLAVVTAIVYLCLEPYYKQWSSRNYDFSHVIFVISVRPIIYLSCSLAVLNGASLLWRLQLQSKTAKRILLFASIFVLFVYYSVPLLYALGPLVYEVHFDIAYVMANVPVLFLLPGIGLFLGAQKYKPNKHDNTSQAS